MIAEAPSATPTRRLGVDVLPARCGRCGSRILDCDDPEPGEPYGRLGCMACGQTVCWLLPRPDRPHEPMALVVDPKPKPAVRVEYRTRAITRGAGCTDECTDERGHDPVAHEVYGAHRERLAPPALRTGRVETGALVLHLDERRACVDGDDIRLTPTEWAILRHLGERLGVMCPHADMIASIWPGKIDASTHLLRVNLTRMRGKLGAAGCLVETRTHVGYLLRHEPVAEAAP